MKQITFRALQTNTSWLKELPVAIVRYNKIIAIIVQPHGVIPVKDPKDGLEPDNLVVEPRNHFKVIKASKEMSLEETRAEAIRAIRRG